MPMPSTTAGTTIGSMNSVRITPPIIGNRRRRPSAASTPSTVASAVVPKPMIRLLTIALCQTGRVNSSPNQRNENDGIG
ncbi:hypothetical protein D3C80_1836390 [compost metagenome]